MPPTLPTVLFGELQKCLANVIYSGIQEEANMAKVATLAVVENDNAGNSDATRHRASAFNLTHVPNYPKKLVIYQLEVAPQI